MAKAALSTYPEFCGSTPGSTEPTGIVRSTGPGRRSEFRRSGNRLTKTAPLLLSRIHSASGDIFGDRPERSVRANRPTTFRLLCICCLSWRFCIGRLTSGIRDSASRLSARSDERRSSMPIGSRLPQVRRCLYGVSPCGRALLSIFQPLSGSQSSPWSEWLSHNGAAHHQLSARFASFAPITSR